MRSTSRTARSAIFVETAYCFGIKLHILMAPKSVIQKIHKMINLDSTLARLLPVSGHPTIWNITNQSNGSVHEEQGFQRNFGFDLKNKFKKLEMALLTLA